MSRIVLLVAVLVGIGLIFQDKLVQKAADLVTGVTNVAPPCQVEGIKCGDLARMLNAMRPGKYYEEAGKLLNVSEEDMTLFRSDNNTMVFMLSGGEKVVHYQGRGHKEPGSLLIVFPDKLQMKFDAKGNFLSQSYQ